MLNLIEYLTCSDMSFFDVTLPKNLSADKTLNLVLETIQTHATRPWPEVATQKEEQKMKYSTDLFVLSPYHTLVQRTKLRCVSPDYHLALQLNLFQGHGSSNPVLH